MVEIEEEKSERTGTHTQKCRHRYVYEHYDNVDVDCAALFVVIILHNFAADLRNFCIFATSFCTQTFARAHTQRRQNMNMIMNTNTKKLG